MSGPSLRAWDSGTVVPHAHMHPPSHIPPAAPVPLPALFMIMPIPFMSAATRTLIEDSVAARCTDMGINAWCGGLFPFAEVSFGSEKVLIEGWNAARQNVDLTSHCSYAAKSSSAAAPGGDVAAPIAAGPLAAGRGALGAAASVKNLIESGKLKIEGDDAYKEAVMKDLLKIAETGEGQALIGSIANNKHPVTIKTSGNEEAKAKADNPLDAEPRYTEDPNGGQMLISERYVNSEGAEVFASDRYARVTEGEPGPGSPTTITYNPIDNPDNAPTDTTLFHEMVHADHNSDGTNHRRVVPADSDPEWRDRNTNQEEYDAVQQENGHRAQEGVDLRTGHNDPG